MKKRTIEELEDLVQVKIIRKLTIEQLDLLEEYFKALQIEERKKVIREVRGS